MAEYILKHKNRNAVYFSLDEDGDFDQLELISNKDIPVLGNGTKNIAQWIRERSIPESRSGLDKILNEAGCKTAQEYMIRNLALSLSDTYWICPANYGHKLRTYPAGRCQPVQPSCRNTDVQR